MDFAEFQCALEAAVADELRKYTTALDPGTIRSVPLDVHPWHGHIGVCVLTADDPAYESVREQREDRADWRFLNLAATPTWSRVAGARRVDARGVRTPARERARVLATCARALAPRCARMSRR